MHKLHLLFLFEYALALVRTSQDSWNVLSDFLSFQMHLLSSVEFSSFSFRKECLCAFQRVLNSPSVSPTYVCSFPDSSFIVALYIMDFCLQEPFRGQSSFTLQLQPCSTSGMLLFSVIFLLWLSIMDFTLGIQLYDTLTVFRLNSLFNLLPLGKQTSTSSRNRLPIFVFTLLL